MFNYKNKIPSECSEEKSREIALKFYSSNLYNKVKATGNDTLNRSQIEETNDKIELHSIVGPYYDDPNQYELIHEFTSYRELIEKNLLSDLRQILDSGEVTRWPTIQHPLYITRSRSFCLTYYINSYMPLNEDDMNILGVYDWFIDYYKNRSNIEFLEFWDDENFEYSYYDICSQDDFEKELDNYFSNYLCKHNITLLEKNQQITVNNSNEDITNKKLNNINVKSNTANRNTEINYKDLYQKIGRDFFYENNSNGINKIIIEHPNEPVHSSQWSALYDKLNEIGINTEYTTVLLNIFENDYDYFNSSFEDLSPAQSDDELEDDEIEL